MNENEGCLKKIRSSVGLQMCLSVNFYSAPVWALIEWHRRRQYTSLLQQHRHSLQEVSSFDSSINHQIGDYDSNSVSNFLWTSSYVLLCIVEAIRLYAGNVGNQLEQFQPAVAFVFLSVCFQLPNHIFRLCLFASWRSTAPADVVQVAASLILFTLLCLEILFSAVHLRVVFKRICHRFQVEL